MYTSDYQACHGIDPQYIDADGNVYDEDDLGDLYEDMLEEMGPVLIGGLSYSHAEAFKTIDPIAYRCGMLDYQSALEWDEWTSDHEWIVEEDEDEDEYEGED